MRATAAKTAGISFIGYSFMIDLFQWIRHTLNGSAVLLNSDYPRLLNSRLIIPVRNVFYGGLFPLARK
ncbi:hypothetical protein ALP16_102696 [Pseudomonas savastanoi]|uniref:Uncharacterized protein n=1 Tax=Pseudomonas savastanoi TaxID=29438 RepID=A0A3M5ZRH6_PSESS|nr:hypothetical protein ALO74_102617 [Pseudomonas syringae pv. cunninghamiae]RMV09623.1 hypothetical protein ALP17_110633 [Pseudomonas savastanoi]RMV13075.1 hypothetical protein ALP16_102696 [Pseudomonas savastanoi]RMV13948.1 hypothetical protein ALP15_102638 [Pseudomonas savastanoi]